VRELLFLSLNSADSTIANAFLEDENIIQELMLSEDEGDESESGDNQQIE